jgi:solute carrier family 66 (lysosomal lysine-arginine transporter), member 1
LSLTFLLIWLLGDVFNILGAVLQGVLPTMIVLAVYYTLADIVLLLQCFYYRGFTLSDAPTKTENGTAAQPTLEDDHVADEESPLLSRSSSPPARPYSASSASAAHGSASNAHHTRRHSSLARTLSSSSGVDGTHLSPATPLLSDSEAEAPAARYMKPISALQSMLFNTTALVLVCAAGAFGWWLSVGSRHGHGREGRGDFEPALGGGVLRMLGAGRDGNEYARDHEELEFDTLGQVFGYLCAVFYLGSRLPQLLLNYRRQSTEGVSILFFLFACVGNLTYVMSILAYDPICYHRRRGYGEDLLFAGDLQQRQTGQGRHHRWGSCEGDEWWPKYSWYMLVNLSWLIGSAGTLLLDFAIFVQFWMYKGRKPQHVVE